MSKAKKRQWGKWEALDESFDQGGQGQIYHVIDNTGERAGTYVLKELKNPKRLARFESEIQAIGSLSPHKNVVSLIDSGIYRYEDKPAYVMPQADMALDDYLTKAELSISELLDTFSSILSGVEHIHNANIIHRDIKPENILIFSGIPKLSDLGLCLIADAPRHTHTEEAVGPRYYMAPELEDGRQPDVTYSADIYSLGKLMYFMLSKSRKIFAREKFREGLWNLERQHEDERFAMFDKIFEKSITLRPSDRYASVADFIIDIKNIKDKFNQHPLSTLMEKIPGIDLVLSAPPDLLILLTEKEWKKLLELRTKHKSPYSKDIFDGLSKSLSDVYAAEAANELLRNGMALDPQDQYKLASKIVLSLESHFQLWGSKKEIFILAIQSGDERAINAMALSLMPADNTILKFFVPYMGILAPEGFGKVLLCAMQHRFEGKEEFLLSLRPENIPDDALGLYVGGLANVGSQQCLKRLVKILCARSLHECPELIQGLALSKNENIYEALITSGKFDGMSLRMLELLQKATNEIIQKREKSYEEENDNDH